MNICIVGSSKKFFGGISAYTIVMANAFAEQGHKVSVILLRNLVPLFLYPGKERVGKGEYQIDFLPGIEVYNGMDWNSPVSWVGAYRFLQKQKPDAVIMHWWTSSVAHMQFLLALFKNMLGKKTRVILEMHEVVDTLEEKILPIRLYSRIGGKSVINFCDCYTAHSDDARQAIINTYKLGTGEIYVVPHGPYNIYGNSDRVTAREQLHLDGFTILYFGMIREYKGVSLLIKAFNKILAEDACKMHLIIAGEDWGDDTELQQSLQDSPYPDRIVFRPEFMPDEKVSEYFSASDVVVLPYLRTCGSGVVNIAVAQGKPVITSNLSTMKECLDNYQGALFFPVGDIDSLCDRLMKAYQSWRQNGTRQYQFSGTSWEDIINKYEKIITRLTS